MKSYETKNIRNIALAGHTASGKTSLTEALMWTLKQSARLGKTDDGTTLADYDPEEVRRKCSVQLSVIPVEHEGVKINLLDLPGFRDFVGEIKGGLRASDGMVLVFDATGGVETGAEFAWQYSLDFNLPRAVFINKLDKEHTSFENALNALKEELGARVIPLTLPVGEAESFDGVVDLLKMQHVIEGDQKTSYKEVPDALKDQATSARAELIEMAAEGDDELMMKVLEDEELTPDEILQGLKGALLEGRIVPVLCGSIASLKGLRPLLDFMVHCMPDPTERPGLPARSSDEAEPQPLKVSPEGAPVLYVFKTVSDPYAGRLSFFKVLQGKLSSDTNLKNVNRDKNERLTHPMVCKGKKGEEIDLLQAGDMGAVSKLDVTQTGDTLVEAGASPLKIDPVDLPKPVTFVAVHAKSRADEDKMGMGFRRLMEQDPTLHLERDSSINQTILSGTGETQLKVAANRLKDLVKIEVDMEIPKVPYRETIKKTGEGQGKYKKQTGGHGQYGDCWMRLEPLPEGSGFEFEWAIVGGVIPSNYQSAIEKGLQEAMGNGVLSGHMTVDVKATCYDGSYHPVDSSDMAFKTAASLAFKNVIPKCNPVILEPIYKVTVTVPEEYMGDVMGDANGRRGRILGMNPAGKKQVIQALVPLAELYTYSRQLNSLTQGRGVFEMQYDHYEQVPGDVQQKIIEQTQREREEASS